MSRKPRRNHSPALKAEVALEWSGRRIEDLQFALAESLKRQVSAGLQLLKLSKLGSNSGRGLVRELCPRAAAPLIHLPLEPQRLIRQLGVQPFRPGGTFEAFGRTARDIGQSTPFRPMGGCSPPKVVTFGG